MKLEATLYVQDKIIEQKTMEIPVQETWMDELELGLRLLCKHLDISYPLWLQKNTKEFAQFRQTFFMFEQFDEECSRRRFDRMQFKWLE